MFASASVRINLNEAFSIILYQGYRPVSPNSAAINFIQSETLRRFLARRILNDFDFFADFGVVHVGVVSLVLCEEKCLMAVSCLIDFF
jgi:hypothetical protein